MKYLIVLLILPFSVFSQNSEKDIKEKLIQLNEDIYKEYALHKNEAFFNEHVKDDFILIAGIGITESKSQAIKGIKNLNVSSVDVVANTIILNGDSAIIVGVLKLDGKIMGNPIPKMRYMSVFAKHEGLWKLQARSMTPIREMKKKQ
ncbi:nuclear transport factor 2 family protein [uncultured Psychroserpens sp.]|uniref:nuclear transport factor 2 family protein n=1 Tax=uncultured Psychroserpens sp. TaxID=255436 RepID=UPI00262BF767|nr:nuclear transport factor 2 family protein [uncultured Psychroserpens sp.]